MSLLKNLSDNLNLLMAKARLNSSELARLTGLPATTIKRIRNNEQANPTISTIMPLANYFALTISELLGAELNPKAMEKETGKLRKIPLLSWQECRHYDSLDYTKQEKTILTERELSHQAYALLVETSDWQIFPKHSLIILEPKISPKSGDYILITHHEYDTVSIKKYLVETDQIYLKSLVPGIGLCELKPEYKILAVIVQYKVELRSDIKN